MNNYNIIFLDIDGVLNGYNTWNTLGWKIVDKIHYKPLTLWYKRIAEPFGIHERKVKRLAKIVKATNAKIVMSSSWRRSWWKRPYEIQNDNQKRLTDLLNKYDIEVIDITPTKLITDYRGDEIRYWLCEHKDDVRSFIILDDEKYGMSPYTSSPRFIQTAKKPIGDGWEYKITGLNRTHVKRAITQLHRPITDIFD